LASKQGFSLLEVLIAIVLLAVVVAVCVPYLRAGNERNEVGESSEFHTQLAESLASAPFPNRNEMTVGEYTEWARLNGWTCEEVNQKSLLDEQSASAGVWVVISDGHSSSMHWASPEVELRP
jgi:prepilin-type N-terminal cleavage/methylation domain-containing protein